MLNICFTIVLVATVLLGLAIWVLRDTPIGFPDSMRARIMARINENAGPVDIGISGMAVVMDRNWVPRLQLENVTIDEEQSGQRLASLARAETSLDLSELLTGQLRPEQVHLSGARMYVRRAEDGSFDISFGNVANVKDLAGIINQIDTVIERDYYTDLEQITADNISLRFEDARSGRAWSMDGATVNILRRKDMLTLNANLSLLGDRAYATSMELSYASRIGETSAQFGMSFTDMPSRDIASQIPALSWLNSLDAPISGSLRASMGNEGRLGPLNASLQIGQGVLQPNPATKPIRFKSASSYVTYDPENQKVTFREISLQSEWGSAQAEGQAILLGMEQGWPESFLGQIRISRITANPDDFYPEPIEIEGAMLDVKLQIEPFELRLGEMSIDDGARHLVLDGHLKAEPAGWNLALNGRLDTLDPQRLLQLWPVKLEEKTRTWISENVKQAHLSDIQVGLRLRPGEKPDVMLGFDYQGLQTTFSKGLPPIREGSGHAVLDGDRFVITADSGHVQARQGGRIDIAGTSFIVPDVTIKRGPAQVDLRTRSTITAALSLLDEAPFRVMQKAGKPVDLAQGTAALKGRLDFPLKRGLRTEEVKFTVEGVARDVQSAQLIPGHVLTAPRLEVLVETGRVAVSGPGRVDGVPLQASWETGLGPETEGRSRVSGWIELSQHLADAFGLGLPPGSLSGKGRAQIDIALQKGAPGRLELQSDLAGVGLTLPQIGWSKPAGSTGNLQVEARIDTPPRVDRLYLSANGLEAEGAVDLNPDGQLDEIRFSRVRIGDWFDAPVTLHGRGAGVAPAIQVSGGMIDIRKTTFGKIAGSSGAGASGPVNLALNRLQLTDGIALTDFRADLTTGGSPGGKFIATVNGNAKAVVNGTIIPQNGRSAVRIITNNAGAVLYAADLVKQAREGVMELILVPDGAPGGYRGQLTGRDMRIKDAPTLARILNAMSVVGLLEQLNGRGIHFSEVTASFQLTPKQLTLYSGSAKGASMGISMFGDYLFGNHAINMQGAVSPFYLVNGIGEIFTRRGEGLFGVNYEIKGDARAPQVRVKLLTALTPGALRNIFRRSPPKPQ